MQEERIVLCTDICYMYHYMDNAVDVECRTKWEPKRDGKTFVTPDVECIAHWEPKRD